jgi:hypothetical protein
VPKTQTNQTNAADRPEMKRRKKKEKENNKPEQGRRKEVMDGVEKTS